MIQVVIAEDHHLVRQGIRALLERVDDIEIAGEADNGQHAVNLARDLAPDVLLMDIGMPRLNGIEATERIRSLDLETRVVILSVHSDESLVRRALQAGARGYLIKDALPEELLLAIRAAHRGQTYLSPAVSAPIVDDLLSGPGISDVPDPIDQLTPREREVLQLIAEGHTNQQMAQLMNVTVKTVEKHRRNLMRKLDIHDVAAATRLAIKFGLISVDE